MGGLVRIAARLGATSLAALVALQLLIGPAPLARAAQATTNPPLLYLSPGCVPDTSLTSVTVTGRNFNPRTALHVYDEYSSDNAGVQVTTTDYGTFTADVPIDPDPSLYHNIWADDVATGAGITFAYYVGCPPGITANPKCATGPGPIAITGQGWEGSAPANIEIDMYDSSGTLVTSKSIAPAASFKTSISPSSLPTGDYRITATQSYVGDSVIPGFTYTNTVYFAVPCPTVTITPNCVDNAGTPDDPPLSITVTVANFINDVFFRSSPYLEIVYDAGGQPQEFLTDGAADGDYVITPYQRPAGTYTVIVKQGYDRYGNSRAGTNLVWEQATTTFSVPCFKATPSPPPTPTPSPTAAAFSPKIALDITCGAPQLDGDTPHQYALTVTGSGFVPNAPVSVTFGADQQGPVFPATADPAGNLNAPITPPAGAEGTYRVVAHQDVVGATVADAVTAFSVPCAAPAPLLSSDIACGASLPDVPAAYVVNLTGTGFLPGLVQITFDAGGALPELTVAGADSTGSFVAKITPTGRGPGMYPIVAHQQVTGSGTVVESSVSFTVACTGPQVQLHPNTGPPGLVLTVAGQGFPPNADVLLRWSWGIRAGEPMVAHTDASGAFTRQVLIFGGDFVGLRMLSFELATDPQALASVPPVPYLVTPGTFSPPYSLDGDPYALPGATIVVRH